MRFLLFVFCSCLWTALSAQTDSVKVPFFENTVFKSGSKELVILTHDPQSDFAAKFGHRIYTDSTFLQKINETFYFWVDPNQEKIVDLCGFDMFFYLKTGPNLKLIKVLNSNCGVGATKRFLGSFYENGQALKTDTLADDSIPYQSIKKMVDAGVIIAYYEAYWYGCFEETRFNNGINFPTSIYNGQADVHLTAWKPTRISELISNFFAKHNIESIHEQLINWRIKSIVMNGEALVRKNYYYINDLFVDELILTVYLDSSCYRLLEGVPIDGITVKERPPLIIYRLE